MPKTILVVDDSAITRSVQRQVLSKAGYAVVEAADGVEAQDKAAGVDGVLCDLNMPNLDGMGFLRWFRARPESRRLPFVFMTTETRESHKDAGRVMGASAWVPKPCPPDRLLQVMQRVCPP